MPSSPAISIIVPLYNEQDNVVELQRQMDVALSAYDYELVLVDDGSTDETVARVQPGPRVRLLKMAKNSGQSAAMHAGIYAARGDAIVMLDGDLQNDPLDIPTLLNKLNEGEGYDLVCGYRAKRKDTPFKRIQSRIANAVRSRFVGDGVRDTGCTLKAMRKECREALLPFNGMHRFIPALIASLGYRSQSCL
jgi:dolichol-phosphate mannosyltransferase